MGSAGDVGPARSLEPFESAADCIRAVGRWTVEMGLVVSLCESGPLEECRRGSGLGLSVVGAETWKPCAETRLS